MLNKVLNKLLVNAKDCGFYHHIEQQIKDCLEFNIGGWRGSEGGLGEGRG